MRLRLTPRDTTLYDHFTAAAANLVTGAELLRDGLQPGADRPAMAAKMRDIEHSSDEITHTVMRQLNQTFVTPFDREDIYRLASTLDDVLDAIEEAADRIVLYRLGTLPEGIGAQVEVLQRAAAATAEAMPRLEKVAELQEYWIKVNSLENEADGIYRTLLGDLLAPPEGAPPADVLTVLKIKEVVETLEEAADRIVLYRLGTLPDGIAAQVEVLQRAAVATAEAMPRLEKMAELQEYWITVNSLENEADDIYRTLLGDLLAPPEGAPPADVLTVLKTKEVVETLEEAADAFETVANTVESIAVKDA